MHDYSKNTYGAEWADDYDEIFSSVAPGMVDRLFELSGKGPVLELAIGTGRVALPLISRGIEVRGIDISTEMVERMRQKPGGAEIEVTMGDFAEVDVEGKFSLIYLIFNTIFGLLSQRDQVRCFANVARHLLAGGRFVIEAFVPDLARFDRGQRVQANKVERDRVILDMSQHDLAKQLVTAQWVELSPSGIKLRPVVVRYAWPSELDLMGELAGLELEDRWGGWEREPFTNDSSRHVSVYKVPGA